MIHFIGCFLNYLLLGGAFLKFRLEKATYKIMHIFISFSINIQKHVIIRRQIGEKDKKE